MNKCLTEFDEQAFINGIRQEEAEKQERNVAKKMFAKGYSMEEVKDIIDGLSVDELRQIKDDLKSS